MRIFLSFFFLIFLAKSIAGFAQNPCAIALSEAEDKYDQGRLYDIEGILKECLSNFTNEEKVRAYRLLTLTYLFLNYEEKADSSFLKLLNVNPIYETDDDLDPLELINHSKKFTTKPKYILSGKIGTNISRANQLLDYSITKSLDKSDKYSLDFEFIIGGGAETPIWKDLHLAVEIFYSGKKVHLSDTHFGFYTTDLDIVHREIELPIMLKYNFFKGKMNPYCFGGVSPVFIAKSLAKNIKGVYQIDDEKKFVTIPPFFTTTELKNRFNFSVLFGVGINYKIGLRHVTLEARYSKKMLNSTNVDNRFSLDDVETRDLKFLAAHIEDDLKINKLSILIGYVYPLYKPQKIK